MRTKTLWLGFAVTAALLLAGSADAQRAGKKGAGAQGTCDKATVGDFLRVGTKQDAAAQGTCDKGTVGVGDQGGKGFGKGFGKGGKGKGFGKGGKGGFGRGLTVEEIVERLMAFDKNKDGKVTKDELPERMQDLVAKGDTNKDGALDKAEIEKLANTLAQDGFAGGFGGRGGFAGGFGKGGFGPKGGFGGFGLKGGKGGPQAALAELNLSDKAKEKAEAVVKAHQETVRKLMDMAHSDLLMKMKDVLSEKEFKTFKEAVDRRPPFAGLVGTNAPKSADLEKRLEQLQKSLDDLRKAIKP